MFKNIFIVAIRNLIRNKLYSLTNIIGLSIGITCSILILLWVFDEISYDRFHSNGDRLYMVMVNTDFDNSIHTWHSLPLPTWSALPERNSNIVQTVIADRGEDHLLTVGEKKVIMTGMAASEHFLDMFKFSLLKGEVTNILNDISSIVITESTAKALFGEENAMDQVILLDDKKEMKVVGILKDIPSNSTLDFDFLLPWKYKLKSAPYFQEYEDKWIGYFGFPVYVELNDPERKTEVESSIKNLLQDHGMENMNPELFLYPMSRWRLYSQFDNGIEKGGLNVYVKLFSMIAVFIIVIACINFINLSTARSVNRAKEVGVRKCIGSNRQNLVIQFISESMITSIIAYIIALLITQTVLPFYNNLVEKELVIDFQSWNFWIFSIVIVFITGIISGSYPAFYLSSFQPIKILMGKLQVGRNANLPRKVLVTVQFSFSILLIIGTLVIFKQMQLVKNRQLGYEQSNLITIELNEELKTNYGVLKDELLKTGEVKAVTVSNSPPTRIYNNSFLDWPGKPEDIMVAFANFTCDHDYIETMGVAVLEGRNFSEDFISDSSAIIINKAGMEVMNLEDPIGTELLVFGNHKRKLIGIVDNVLMESPFHEVRPLFMILGEPNGYLILRINDTDDLQASLKSIESVFNEFNSAYPFDYTFVDIEFQEKFKTIDMSQRLTSLFAVLAIIITGLGLFGLTAYTTEQRTKEISIRKVMGASVMGIITLISKDISRLIIIAFVISSPLSWWLLDSYLDRYPIRTDIHFWIFPITGLFAFVFALIIVISQALKAAHRNPAVTLKDE
jgi:ABC-type antimicrobial peptide transport system permease subunit